MEADSSWTYLQAPTTCPYPELNEMRNLNGHERSRILGGLVRLHKFSKI